MSWFVHSLMNTHSRWVLRTSEKVFGQSRIERSVACPKAGHSRATIAGASSIQAVPSTAIDSLDQEMQARTIDLRAPGCAVAICKAGNQVASLPGQGNRARQRR